MNLVDQIKKTDKLKENIMHVEFENGFGAWYRLGEENGKTYSLQKSNIPYEIRIALDQRMDFFVCIEDKYRFFTMEYDNELKNFKIKTSIDAEYENFTKNLEEKGRTLFYKVTRELNVKRKIGREMGHYILGHLLSPLWGLSPGSRTATKEAKLKRVYFSSNKTLRKDKLKGDTGIIFNRSQDMFYDMIILSENNIGLIVGDENPRFDLNNNYDNLSIRINDLSYLEEYPEEDNMKETKFMKFDGVNEELELIWKEKFDLIKKAKEFSEQYEATDHREIMRKIRLLEAVR